MLVGPQNGSTYSITVVATDGAVVASATATTPTQVSCGSAAAPLPLPVSTSNDRVYFMDHDGNVNFLAPGGATDPATKLPISSTVRSMFAVSPDNTRIAVVESTYSASGADTKLYVEDLNGGTNRVELYSESGAYTLWPMGWLDWGSGSYGIVLAKVVSCTQGGGPFCCGPLELHVVDPTTGNRRYTLGGNGCVVAGPPSTSGVICEDSTFTQMRMINWTGGQFNQLPINGPEIGLMSPDGYGIAWVTNGETIVLTGPGFQAQGCMWIDDRYMLAGGDALNQPRILDSNNGNTTPVAAAGDCAGRIPGVY